jgi:serine O-acetyltransferase
VPPALPGLRELTPVPRRPRDEPVRAARGLWPKLYQEAVAIEAREPVLAGSMRRNILEHPSLGSALSARLAAKLGDEDLPPAALQELFVAQHAADPGLADAAACDLLAFLHRDPACASLLAPLLHFSGFLAVQAHRLAHRFWLAERRGLALHLQARCSQVFGVDIHPAARLGMHLMLDHALGIVIGETAVVEDDVSLLHGVTLGGRGKSGGDRHPKVRRGASLGAGAQIIGNIELGVHARVGAGSVVLIDVPPFCTAVGVPARVLPPTPLERSSAAALDATP